MRRVAGWAGAAVVGLALIVGVILMIRPALESAACPAVGHVTQVRVHVSGDAAAVQKMRLCYDKACVIAHVVTGDEGAIGRGRQVSLHEWTMQTPDGAYVPRVALTAFDSDGAQLATHTYELHWERVAPDDRCDTSQQTDPVTLDVP